MIVISSDDGYLAPGFEALVASAISLNRSMKVGATELAWTSHGTGTGFSSTNSSSFDGFRPVVVADRVCNVYSGPPAYAVKKMLLEIDGENGEAELILSGVNMGPNVGKDLIHSGTFGIALMAMWLGISAVATSLDDIYSVDENNPGILRFECAATVAKLCASMILKMNAPILVNINVPNSIYEAQSNVLPARPKSINDGSLPLDMDVLSSGNISLTAFSNCRLVCDEELTKQLAQSLSDEVKRAVF